MAYIDRNKSEDQIKTGLASAAFTIGIGVALVSLLTFKVPGKIFVWYPPATNPTPEMPPLVDQPDTRTKPDDRHVTTAPDTNTHVKDNGDALGPFFAPLANEGLKGDLGSGTIIETHTQPPHVDHSRSLIALPGNVISTVDYPSRSINLGEHGTTVAHFTVGANGRVQTCSTDSKPSSALAAMTCQLITSRFRFQPALDEDGSAVAQEKTQKVTWVLPEE